ncbi:MULTISPECIES: histidine kinase famiy protein [unclassified Sphingomonas]|uniref:histidine kinase famiy protein n=1 Tax=unclassified Sphingomonas TaxID=196159 RepID=UPI0006F6B2C9|nr:MULTISPECIES: histidine kinase famiy protein [unclassified Sphingomonas]KQM29042.1 histidine kinase [Sphingomonas sp. Leaf9]KQM45743.1 histidine kinase [Sphingomonas sp. Leaf11]
MSSPPSPEKPLDIVQRQAAMSGREMHDPGNGIFFAAVKTTRMPMIVTDPNLPDNPIVFANPAFLNMTGYSAEEVLGHNCRFLQGADTDPDTVAEIARAIRERRETSVEIVNYKKNGSSFWNALFISPVFDADGTLRYHFASQLDVTRRRDAEEALRQAQKMEAVGQLTGGIAHDFNNLLTVIQGFADVLLNQLDRNDALPPDRARRSLRAVMDAADRGAELTQQLLAFSRRQKLSGRVTNIDDLVRALLPMLRRTIGDVPITIEVKPCGDHCNARIDPVQAEAAIIGIVMNARDAMPDGGTITLSAEHVELDGSDPRYGDKLSGTFVALSIADTGSGMSEEVRARVTEPFFTTKDQGKGTGLGLSMVYGFMKQSDGALHIASHEGHGTTVSLLFPAATSVPEPIRQRRARSDSDLRGQETVLVVEDQRDLGDLAEAILKDFGYTVLRAGNGPEAIAVLEGDAAIDLLFTDLIMPGGMNGVMVAREGRRLRPRMKVLLTTGYAEASIERVDARGTEFDLIGKPYRRADLAQRIRQVLDGPTGTG